MPQDFLSRITRNVDLGGGHFLLEFEVGDWIESMQAAEFFMVGVPGAETLLRRPFSLCAHGDTFQDATTGTAQMLYKVFGKGTAQLSRLSPGATISVLGPLGNGFGTAPTDRVPVFVAGGIGSAPFPQLARQLREHPHPPRMFYGAATAGDLPLLDWFRQHCATVTVSTDDGSLGETGRVTGPLETWLAGAPDPAPMLFACGPDPMLRAVTRLALKYEVPCELSLEAHMACGFGVCIGCVVPTHSDNPQRFEYTRLCVEGPVLPAERMAWDL